MEKKFKEFKERYFKNNTITFVSDEVTEAGYIEKNINAEDTLLLIVLLYYIFRNCDVSNNIYIVDVYEFSEFAGLDAKTGYDLVPALLKIPRFAILNDKVLEMLDIRCVTKFNLILTSEYFDELLRKVLLAELFNYDLK